MRDMPENFGGHFGSTVLDPLGFVILLACAIYLLTCKRALVLVPFLIIASVLPQSLRLVILSLDFSMVRTIVIIGLMRLIMKNETSYFKYTTADKLVISFLLAKTFFASILHANFGIVVQNIGFALDAFGAYFIARCCIRSFDDLRKALPYIAVLVCLMAPLYWFEFSTAYNLFSVFDGVNSDAWIRNGEIRARGPMPHAILAGCFWACFAPLFLAFVWRPNSKRPLYIIAILSILLITISASSSTPLFSLIAGFGGWGMYLFRKHLRAIRWYTFIGLVILHFSMNTPVWHLISRVSFSSSSTGYFRFLLIDSAVKHAKEWILIGTKYTGHWFYGAQDITNQFILVGVQGGIVPLTLFIAQIIVAYRGLGIILTFHKKNKYDTFLAWGLGASLLVHLTNFIGVSYFGQIVVLWYSLLGIIASLEFSTRQQAKREKTIRDDHRENPKDETSLTGKTSF